MIENTKDNKVFSVIIEKYYLTRKRGEKEEEYKASYSFCELNTGRISFCELIDSNYISLLEQVLIQNNPKDMMVWTNKEFTASQLTDLHDILASQGNINFKMHEYTKQSANDFERMLELYRTLVVIFQQILIIFQK